MEEIKRICGACLKEKNIKQFHKNANLKDGYEKRCKTCKQLGKKLFKEIPVKKIRHRKNALGLSKPTKDDYEGMYKLLKMIGYEPKDVHQQFCDKYNLTPKKRVKRIENPFTPEDFIL